MGQDKKRFPGVVNPITSRITTEGIDTLTAQEKITINQFVQVLSNPDLFVQVKEQLWSKNQVDLLLTLKDYESLRSFIDTYCADVMREKETKLKFVTQLQ